ncbi:hypothetical protein OG786_13805 [Streptomyces sp. NBC_00101]|uniref:hypothetical protein n=1 Tax=Streptomyces sp. NBC_00101 TaxID=2975651 RepID=UPI003246806D
MTALNCGNAPSAAAPAPNRPQGIEPSQTLGRHWWVIRGTMALLTGYRRLARRHERDHLLCLVFCDLATIPPGTTNPHGTGGLSGRRRAGS